MEIREKWLIAGPDKMKLSASSLNLNNPWSFVIVYGPKDRKTLTSLRKIKSFKKSREFVEPLFHERDHERLMTRLVSHQFVPPWARKLPPPQFLNNQTVFTPENFVSLEPFNGSVNYSIGVKKTTSGGQGPRLWVEQDSFVIKKIRLGSKVEFVNDSFQSFIYGLKLPAKQNINWENGTAQITLLKVEKTKTKKKDWLIKEQEKEVLPTNKLIKEFYSRFR